MYENDRDLKQAITKYIQNGLKNIQNNNPPLAKYNKDFARNDKNTIRTARSVIYIFGSTHQYMKILYDYSDEKEKEYFLKYYDSMLS